MWFDWWTHVYINTSSKVCNNDDIVCFAGSLLTQYYLGKITRKLWFIGALENNRYNSCLDVTSSYGIVLIIVNTLHLHILLYFLKVIFRKKNIFVVLFIYIYFEIHFDTLKGSSAIYILQYTYTFKDKTLGN